MPKEYLFQTTVEFEDVDCYRIAHHSRLINLLERARVHLFEDAGLSVFNGKFFLVLVSMSTRFYAPAHLLDSLTVHLQVKKLRHVSLEWEYLIMRGETKIMQAEVKQASVSESMKPCRFPEDVSKLLESYLVTE